MRNHRHETPVQRDWFGLENFLPGSRFLGNGGALYLLDEAGSTNDFLLGRGGACRGRFCSWDEWGWRAEKKSVLPPIAAAAPGTVVVARRQTGGRGRQGRAWLDCGGLNFSVMIPPHRASFERGFSVWLGLLVVLTLREEFNVDARLKWPNDILVGDRKLGGILVEHTGSADRTLIVAGLGLNLLAEADGFPAELQGQATSIRVETGRRIKPAEIAGPVIQRVATELDRFEQEGWRPWRAALPCLDCLLGRRVRLRSGGVDYEGLAVGIGQRGELLLENREGETAAFSFGDVHVLSAAISSDAAEDGFAGGNR